MRRVLAHIGRSGPGATGSCPRPAGRRPPSGPVQPFGERRMSIGQRGRSVTPPVRAADWMAAISSAIRSSVAAISRCIVVRVVARDHVRRVAVAAHQVRSSVSGMRARTVGLAIL